MKVDAIRNDGCQLHIDRVTAHYPRLTHHGQIFDDKFCKLVSHKVARAMTLFWPSIVLIEPEGTIFYRTRSYGCKTRLPTSPVGATGNPEQIPGLQRACCENRIHGLTAQVNSHVGCAGYGGLLRVSSAYTCQRSFLPKEGMKGRGRQIYWQSQSVHTNLLNIGAVYCQLDPQFFLRRRSCIGINSMLATDSVLYVSRLLCAQPSNSGISCRNIKMRDQYPWVVIDEQCFQESGANASNKVMNAVIITWQKCAQAVVINEFRGALVIGVSMNEINDRQWDIELTTVTAQLCEPCVSLSNGMLTPEQMILHFHEFNL